VVLVVGSANADLVIRAGRIPRPGETVLGGDLATHPGGKGANQAVAAARLGAGVRFIGRVGDDALGQLLTNSLAAAGVDVSHLFITRGCPTGVALIVVDDTGQNAICVSPGANAHLTPSDLDVAESAFDGAAVCLLQLEIPMETVRHALALCKRFGVMTILNPAPAPATPLPESFMVAVLTPNESEAAALCDANEPATIDQAAELAKQLARRSSGAVIVTLGGEGAVVADDEGIEHIPAHAVNVIDATGAGDTFSGALACALAAHRPMRDAVRFANAAAALACTRCGAQTAMPTAGEVARLIAGRHDVRG
jgi:ribokinase